MIYSAKPPHAFVSATHTPETRPSVTVHEEDKRPVDTGLLNADGWPIYRTFETFPIGYVGRE